MKSFGNWTTQELRNHFGLDDKESLTALTEWVNVQESLDAQEEKEISALRKELAALNESWNEDELKMRFIAPLMHLIGYGEKGKYNFFYQRTLSAKVGNEELNGIVDMVVAKGWESPMIPYFFLHEYKQEEKKGDARAQLLAAMLVAQALNGNEKPVYGVYLIGASWRFIVLVGKDYAVERFDATKEQDIVKIFQMLKWVKHYIEKELGIVT
ncbi:MAG: hypothetical protein ACKVTZ_16895 [Bacteroidia bacterium]